MLDSDPFLGYRDTGREKFSQTRDSRRGTCLGLIDELAPGDAGGLLVAVAEEVLLLLLVAAAKTNACSSSPAVATPGVVHRGKSGKCRSSARIPLRLVSGF